MAKNIQAIRGMNDCSPTESPLWQWIEGQVRQILSSYGYSEVRMPIVESTPLFARAIGEVTDVVSKEMYTFWDNDEQLTLRPEGTAGCVRAAIEHGWIYNNEQRLWYMGPMFRHERPQKGRYRQFHQAGVEVFGIATPDAPQCGCRTSPSRPTRAPGTSPGPGHSGSGPPGAGSPPP